MTTHKVLNANSNKMTALPDKSIALIVTSPPYPMIAMWDSVFSAQNPAVKAALDNSDGIEAHKQMHDTLNEIWRECDRVLIDNGFICINIGDATRTLNENFQLYSNHTQIIDCFTEMGYSTMPDIHWRKPSNAPNKFMGSGMYPAGAYVTYEHEYILIFRKGGKRVFTGVEKTKRQNSAYFWEERNIWFSDLWEIKGAQQSVKAQSARGRSAAFPFEIPYRLVNMYSIEGDTVLDPFAGYGTTALACMASGRNSVSIEIDPEISKLSLCNMVSALDMLNSAIDSRLSRHNCFIDSLPDPQKDRCYRNSNHGFLVKTRQETLLKMRRVDTVEQTGKQEIVCSYLE